MRTKANTEPTTEETTKTTEQPVKQGDDTTQAPVQAASSTEAVTEPAYAYNENHWHVITLLKDKQPVFRSEPMQGQAAASIARDLSRWHASDDDAYHAEIRASEAADGAFNMEECTPIPLTDFLSALPTAPVTQAAAE